MTFERGEGDAGNVISEDTDGTELEELGRCGMAGGCGTGKKFLLVLLAIGRLFEVVFVVLITGAISIYDLLESHKSIEIVSFVNVFFPIAGGEGKGREIEGGIP